MTLQDLVDLFREVVDDKAATPIVSDDLAASYLNEAQTEAARRARLFKDSTSDDICVMTATAGQQYIDLDPRVIFVRRLKIDSKDLPLSRRHQVDMDRMMPNWDAIDYGDVCRYIPDRDTGQIWFDSPFQADDVVRMAVIREPLADMSFGGEVETIVGTATTTSTVDPTDPEVRPRYQKKLVDWAAYRVMNSRDFEEKYDPEGAKRHLDMFEAEFGKQSSAIDETWIERENQYDEFDGTF